VKRVAAVAGPAVLLAALLGGCGTTRVRPAPMPPPTSPVVTAPATAGSGRALPPSDAELLAVPDAVPRHEPRARLGNPAFYEVLGQRYTILADSSGYLERGVASWYGRDFHGERTSTGEPYDMYSMTAAHRTLPLPAYARVTNLRNGRSIVVRINDRGPFKSNRIIDLSYAAALRLDMVRDGTTLVEVRALTPDGAPPPPSRAGEIYAQAGAFAVEANARTLRDQIAAAGVDHVLLRADAGAGGGTLYRVRIGPIDSVAAFDALVARLRGAGIGGVTLAPN
jgi:rare lipoprotein A